MTLRKTGMGVVVCYTRRPLFAQCIKTAGVNHDSYAEEILQRTYEWYIDSATDLKTEFAKYYQPEYPIRLRTKMKYSTSTTASR